MVLFVSLCLVALATAAVLFPFTGEAIHKDPRRFWRKLTWRGWVGLLCLASTLVLGLTKELLTVARERTSKAELDKLGSSFESAQRTIKRSDVEARTSSKELRDQIERLNGSVVKTYVSLRALRRDLVTTLGQQNGTILRAEPLVKQDIPNVGSRQPIRISLYRVGEPLHVRLGNTTLQLRVAGIELNAWSYDILDLHVGQRTHVKEGRFTARSGNPAFLVRGPDLALIASVVELPSGAYVPWVGLVPASKAPKEVFISTAEPLLDVVN